MRNITKISIRLWEIRRSMFKTKHRYTIPNDNGGFYESTNFKALYTPIENIGLLLNNDYTSINE